MRADAYTINLRAWANGEKQAKERAEAQVARHERAAEALRRHATFLCRSDGTYHTGEFILRQLAEAEAGDDAGGC